MRKYLAGFILFFITLPLHAQLDTANIAIANFRLHDGTFSWRGTGTYHDRTSWNSSAYLEGHMKTYSGLFRQNFRLLVPQGYDPNYEPGYPLMLMWHGGGERANCLDNSCYYGTPAYNPNTQPNYQPGDDTLNLMNNDHNLAHGGQSPHLNAWNLAGTMKVGDPGLPDNAFPGFVVFPQMMDGWENGDIRDAVRLVRLLMKKYNIDPDRVYTHGLSYGGRGLLNGLVEAEWLFAAAAPMSAIPPHNNFRTNINDVVGIPMWFFQGGQDTNPTPIVTETTVALFRQAGGNVRYTLYPELGHGTWNTAYKEPDFFPFFLGRTKRDIHVPYGVTEICPTTGAPVRLSVVRGFRAYQWERNGVVIPGANAYTYNAVEPGVYRARFSRTSYSPTAADWNQWSDPVTITAGTPITPILSQTGSVVLRDLNNYNNARLVAPAGASTYTWYKDGVATTLTGNAPIFGPGANPCCPNAGTYTVVTSSIDGCPSEPSNSKTVFFSNLAPLNIPRPTGLTGTLTTPTSVLLRWNDVSGLERNYELWRRRSTDNSTSGWTMIALVDEDDVLYEDINLESGTQYWYKIRAVSNTGRSPYAPGDSRTTIAENLIITTGTDVTPPATPQNLVAEQLDTDVVTKTVSIKLTWSPSVAGDLRRYVIKYGNTTIISNDTQTTYTVSGLPLNQYFYFTVSAEDQTGNISPPSNQAMAHTYIDGFFWYHSTGAFTDITTIPPTIWTTPEFKGKSENVNIADRTQEDFFTFKYYGYIYVTTGGNYRLRTRSNDGAQIFLDGNPTAYSTRRMTVADGTCHTQTGAQINLTPGPHSIEIRYYQYTGDKCLELWWQGPDAAPGNAYALVPDSRIQSFEVMAPPFQPLAPENVSATATGMTTIDLAWIFNGVPPAEYEIYRSTSAAGTYSVVNRVGTLSYTDTGLVPNTTYYYKLRTVNTNGTSEFSAVVNATTLDDNLAPTAPSGLTVYAATLTGASLGWTASTDNAAVAGYEVYLNGILHGTTQNTYYEIKNLQPMTDYTAYVIAFDATGNKSAQSNTVNFNTSVPVVYYSKASGDLNNVATWGILEDGSGTAPANFTTNGSYFTVVNRGATNTGGIWKVEGTASKIIVTTSVTLTLDNAVTGNVEVQDGSSLILNNPADPTLIYVGPTSTVHYNPNATQVQQIAYGNLVLSGNSNKTFAPGITPVLGNLTVANNLAIKGGTGNSSMIQLHGDLTFSGSPGFTPSNVSVSLDLKKAGTQNLQFDGTLALFKISTGAGTNAVLTSSNPGTIRLGSDVGGGLSLATGSSLNLDDHTLEVIASGTINSNGETGVIHTTNGSITVTSTSTANSNLYFDATNKQLSRLTSDLRSTGSLITGSAVTIADGLKIKNGVFNANGNVTLASTAAKTANLEEIEGTGVVTGTIKAQRYFNYKANTYRYITSPVDGMKVSDWQAYFAITGDFTGASGTSKIASLYTWEPTGWVGYPLKTYPAPYNNNQAPILKSRGYSALIKNTTPFTLVNTGVPHQGTVVFSLFPETVGVAHTEWNLLGNPYASTIAWSLDPAAWTSQDVGSVIAVRNNSSSTIGQFQYFDGLTGLGIGQDGDLDGGRIAPGQAFYVNTIGANPQLTVTEKAKSTGQQIFFREGASTTAHLRLRLSRNSRTDEALIIFSENGSETYSAVSDGAKMANVGMFNIYTWKQTVPLAISNQNSDFCEKTMKVGVSETAAGTYALAVESAETLSGVTTLSLIDHFTNTTIDLFTQTSYTFTISSDPNSYGSNRFEVKLVRPTLDIELDAAVLNGCETSEVTINESQDGVLYALQTADGTVVSEQVTGTGGSISLNVPHQSLGVGINDLVIAASFKGCSSALIDGKVSIENVSGPQLTSHDLSICYGSKATLSVPASESVQYYQWADSTGIIKSATGSTFTTNEITSEATYTVTPVLTNGCKGKTAVMMISPQMPEDPELLFANDTLYTSVLGSSYYWTFNNEVLEGVNKPYILPEADGVYNLTVVIGGCEKTSRAFTITGAGENLAGSLYELYPNPTTGERIILNKTIPGKSVSVRITDVLGREIYRDHLTPEGQSISLHPAQRPGSGVYFLRLDDGTVRKQIRFIIRNEN
jgi:hypothetical protein